MFKKNTEMFKSVHHLKVKIKGDILYLYDRTYRDKATPAGPLQYHKLGWEDAAKELVENGVVFEGVYYPGHMIEKITHLGSDKLRMDK